MRDENMELMDALLKMVPKFTMAQRLMEMATALMANYSDKALVFIIDALSQFQGPELPVLRLDTLSKVMDITRPSPAVMNALQVLVPQLTAVEKNALVLQALGNTNVYWIVIWLRCVDPHGQGESIESFSMILEALTSPENLWQVKLAPWQTLVSHYASAPLLSPFVVRGYPLFFQSGIEVNAAVTAIHTVRETRRTQQHDLDLVERWYVLFLDVWSRVLPIDANTHQLLTGLKYY
jgi:hypothetical protein